MKNLSPLAITSAVVGYPGKIGVITRMDGTEILFSDSDEPIVVDGDTYAVIPGMQISAIRHTSNGEMPSCQIAGVYGNGLTFDSEDLDTGLYDGASVQIYSVDRMDLSRKGLMFTGSMATIALDPINHLVMFAVKGPAQSAKILMTRKRSPMCQTDLFSFLCGLNKTDYDVATTVATIEKSFVFTVTGSLAQATGYFNQGVVLTSAGVGFKIATWDQSTQTITAHLPCSRLITVGMGLTLYPGCDKTLTGTRGCASFGNQINFQGQPHFNGTAAAVQQV